MAWKALVQSKTFWAAAISFVLVALSLLLPDFDKQGWEEITAKILAMVFDVLAIGGRITASTQIGSLLPPRGRP